MLSSSAAAVSPTAPLKEIRAPSAHPERSVTQITSPVLDLDPKTLLFSGAADSSGGIRNLAEVSKDILSDAQGRVATYEAIRIRRWNRLELGVCAKA